MKPLFYTLREGRLVFASEIKGLLEFPGVEPVVGPDGPAGAVRPGPGAYSRLRCF